MLVPDNEMLDMIGQEASLKKLRARALENGMVPLFADGIEKVRAGITTMDEILRACEQTE